MVCIWWHFWQLRTYNKPHFLFWGMLLIQSLKYLYFTNHWNLCTCNFLVILVTSLVVSWLACTPNAINREFDHTPFVASLLDTQQLGIKVLTDCLGPRIMCPSGAIGLLYKSNSECWHRTKQLSLFIKNYLRRAQHDTTAASWKMFPPASFVMRNNYWPA
jgi:hypothetical protein